MSTHQDTAVASMCASRSSAKHLTFYPILTTICTAAFKAVVVYLFLGFYKESPILLNYFIILEL